MADNIYSKPEHADKRLRYFDAQFLVVDDFIDEQHYHLDRQRRHNRLLHSPGIAEGLVVSISAEGTALKLGRGTAVDFKGRQIVLGNSLKFEGGGCDNYEDGACKLDESSENYTFTLADSFKGTSATLFISYREIMSDKPTVQQGSEGHTRWHEQPLLEAVVDGDDPSGEDGIALAYLSVDDDGKIALLTEEPRVYAGLRLPGERGAEESFALRAVGSGPAEFGGSLKVDGDFQVASNGKQHFEVESSGIVRFGTNNSQSCLKVQGSINFQQNGELISYNTAEDGNLIGDGFRIRYVNDFFGKNKDHDGLVIEKTDENNPRPDGGIAFVNTGNDVKDEAALVVRGNGRIGIGTKYPQNKLDVRGGVVIGSAYSATNIAPADGLLVQGNVGIGTTTAKNKLDVEGGVVIGSAYSGTNTAPNNGLLVQGSVGIGTTTTKNKLDVEGAAVIGSTYSGTNTAPNNGLLVEGNVGIGTTTTKNKLDVEGGAVIGSTYSGTNTAPSNGLLVEGNIGIGTTTTKNKLDIKGGAVIGSTYSGTNLAPTDGLIVEGSVGVGISSVHSDNKLDIKGSACIGATSIVGVSNLAPENGLLVRGQLCVGELNAISGKLYVRGAGVFRRKTPVQYGSEVTDIIIGSNVHSSGGVTTVFGIKGSPDLHLDAAQGGLVYLKEGYTTHAYDVAERFEVLGSIQAGQVAILDDLEGTVRVCDCPYDPRVIGITSTDPAFVMGTDKEQQPIAVCGRVPCLVDADISPIKIGDLLTTSATPGHAQKVIDIKQATGAILGKSLGSLDKGKGKITVFVMMA